MNLTITLNGGTLVREGEVAGEGGSRELAVANIAEVVQYLQADKEIGSVLEELAATARRQKAEQHQIAAKELYSILDTHLGKKAKDLLFKKLNLRIGQFKVRLNSGKAVRKFLLKVACDHPSATLAALAKARTEFLCDLGR